MKKLAFAFFALFFSVLSYAQIEGKWKTIDDETGKPKSIVEIFKKENMVRRWVWVSLLFAITINIFLNSQFYPVLTQYQGGLKMAHYFEKNQLSTQNLFMPKDYEIWSFDFYTQQNTPRKEVSLLKKGDRVLVYENDLQNITQPYKIFHQETHFKITKLSLKFLNPKTRNEKLKKLYLLEILN